MMAMWFLDMLMMTFMEGLMCKAHDYDEDPSHDTGSHAGANGQASAHDKMIMIH